MKRIVIIIAAFALPFATAPRARSAEVEISFDYFYDVLKPAGEWAYSDDYGYCWTPAAAKDESWRPYAAGSWAWTDNGWTWVSTEDFGWVTYHYGRWARLKHRWCWVPGFDWAPAWVSWRQTDEDIGWAPLPPEAQWVADTGFQTWTDSHYDIGPEWFNFVTVEHFSDPEVRQHLVATSENVRIIEKSVNITHITYRQNVVNNIFVGGPELARIERGGRKVRHLELRLAEDFRGERGRDERDHARGFTRVEGNTLFVAAPHIRHDQNIRPPEGVRVRYERQSNDRGWGSGVQREVADRLHEKFRREAGNEDRQKLPPKAGRSPLAIAPPASLPPAREGAERPDTANAPRPADANDPNARRPEGEARIARQPGEKKDPSGQDPKATGPNATKPPGRVPNAAQTPDNSLRPGDNPPGRDPAVRPGVKPGTVDPADPNAPRPGLDNPRPQDPNHPEATRPEKNAPPTDSKKTGAAKPGTPVPNKPDEDDPNKVKPTKPAEPDKTKPRNPDEKSPSHQEAPDKRPRRETPDDANEVKPGIPGKEVRPKAENPDKTKRPSRSEEESAEKRKPASKPSESEEKTESRRGDTTPDRPAREPEKDPGAKGPPASPGKESAGENTPRPRKDDGQPSQKKPSQGEPQRTEKPRPVPDKGKDKDTKDAEEKKKQ